MVDPGGEKVTYGALVTTDLVQEEVALVFRRVRPAAARPGSWVATSETSLGLFGDLLTAAGKWPECPLGKMLPEYDARRMPTAAGAARCGSGLDTRSADVTSSRTWLAPGFLPPRVRIIILMALPVSSTDRRSVTHRESGGGAEPFAAAADAVRFAQGGDAGGVGGGVPAARRWRSGRRRTRAWRSGPG